MQYKAPQAINNMDDAGSKRQCLKKGKKKKERNKTEVDELDSAAFSILPAGGPLLTLRKGVQVYFDKYIL